MAGNVFSKVMVTPTLITNPKVFAFDYVPERFVHREGEMEALAAIFKPLFSNQRGVHAHIGGGVGTGKTLLAHMFAQECMSYGKSLGMDVRTVHVNCRINRSDSAILYSIVRSLQPHFPDRGFSGPEMLTAIRRDIEEKAIHLIVFLDEADVILKVKGSDVVYTLSRMHEAMDTKGGGTLSLVLISASSSLISMMDSGTRDSFKGKSVILKPYNSGQLKDIMAERIEKGLKPGCIGEDIIDLIADIGEMEGSARVPIELLERSALRADAEGRSEITAEDVRVAKSKVTLIDNRLWDMDMDHLLATLAMARSLKKKAYTHTGACEDTYRVVCEEYGHTPAKHTKFWSLMKDLDAWSIFSIKRSGQGVGGNTTLVFLPSISALELENKVMEIIETRHTRG